MRYSVQASIVVGLTLMLWDSKLRGLSLRVSPAYLHVDAGGICVTIPGWYSGKATGDDVNERIANDVELWYSHGSGTETVRCGGLNNRL